MNVVKAFSVATYCCVFPCKCANLFFSVWSPLLFPCSALFPVGLSCSATGRLVGLSLEFGILNPWSVGEGVEALDRPWFPLDPREPSGPPGPPSVSEPGGEGDSEEEPVPPLPPPRPLPAG